MTRIYQDLRRDVSVAFKYKFNLNLQIFEKQRSAVLLLEMMIKNISFLVFCK